MAEDARDRFAGALVGLAVGDAIGTAVEFKPRGSFAPLTDMVGGGPFRLAPGQWTDDTSMALCLATSLLECGGFDARDQMERYVRWWRTGYLSSTGRCFDIGTATAAALRRFRETGEPYAGSEDERSAGNGSIMRLAPVALRWAGDEAAVMEHAALSSRTTHAAVECVEACRLLGVVLSRALEGRGVEEMLALDPAAFAAAPAIAEIASGAWRAKSDDAVRGTGYVVRSLEAALWCFDRSTSFEEAVLRAANLGDDADTTAAITGQIAGAHFGHSAIPQRWRERLALHDEIAELAVRFLARSVPAPDWHREIVAQRIADDATQPGDIEPWEDVREDMLRKLGRMPE